MTPEINDPFSVRVDDLPEDFWPNVDDYVTEDESAMDSIFSKKQQRLLTETLYTSWPGRGDNRSFLACANVGLLLQGRKYVSVSDPWLPEIGLGLQIWHGSYETGLADWLRWCDHQGNLLATGADQRVQAEQTRLQAEQAKFEAMRSKQQAEEATQRAEKLLAQLRALGIEPTKE